MDGWTNRQINNQKTICIIKPNLQRLQRSDGQWSDRSATSGCNLRRCHNQVQWATCTAWHWGSGPHSEGEKAPLVWTWIMVQSREPFTYRLRESVGLEGPRWHGSSWQRGIAESFSSRLSNLMIEICGDLVWDLPFPCMLQASYLEGGPMKWMLSLYLHINQKSDYDIQLTLVISTSLISNNGLSRSENLVPALTWKSNNR